MGIEELNEFYWEKWHSMPWHTAHSIPISLAVSSLVVRRWTIVRRFVATQKYQTFRFDRKAIAIWQPLFIASVQSNRIWRAVCSILLYDDFQINISIFAFRFLLSFHSHLEYENLEINDNDVIARARIALLLLPLRPLRLPPFSFVPLE